MNKIIEKAFDAANYAATFSKQKQILKEEFNQSLIFFKNGGVFTINKELICFVKTLSSITENNIAVLVDDNETPIEILNIQEFLEEIISKYTFAVNGYYTKYSALRQARTVESILEK